ncbi:MAG TPA: UvrD-helicase domain-containing protein [Nitrospira sp.]|nr:UvrD-helicase domain-containing protein [Nitrospira sp.]
MSEGLPLSDSRDRVLAETTWDRNVVVVAGAGTGKTTILVNRILNLLMREPDPLAVTEIVALTFTNKAATEMKQRLRRELGKLVNNTDEPLVTLFRTRYQLTTVQVMERAALALDQLEKAQIGTLHSFAAHLLRLHPLESGIDPSFQEDDASRFKELFESRWEAWLAHELGTDGRHHDRWRLVLAKTNLNDLRLLAETLAGESWDLDDVERQCRTVALDGPLREWIRALQTKTDRLLAVRAGAKQLKAEKMLSAASGCFASLLERGAPAVAELSGEDRTLLEKDLGKPTAGWGEADFAEAKSVIAVAQQLLSVDQPYFREVLGLLFPFLAGVQQAFLASGWISFDGLLSRCKTLLRDHPTVRARIKRSYRAILVDEFQDTDPVQYEIMLYLAERAGSSNNSWQDLELEPGKLFIVGDPKQSIYAFRRADIEAFERVVGKILSGGGVAYSLVTNFRSDGSVLTVVNGLFDRLFQAESHVQPANERLTARPQRKPEISTAGVYLRIVTAADDEDEFDAAAATRAEADALARWIKEDLLAGASVVDREGRTSPLQPGNIALIFRKLTQAQDYLDALRRHGIAYLTDGEKHFYRRQEIIDLVNMLRVIDNPHDRIAMVGLLRAPLGGIADQDLIELLRLGLLDYTDPAPLSQWSHPAAGRLARFYERLRLLHRRAPLSPVPEVIDLVFSQFPVLELAATSLHGEQAVANLLKARDMAEDVADRPHLTLTGFVDMMAARLLDQPDEAESALAEASPDAVRILTIHKAKGLEFPVVVLPGLHQGARVPRKGPALHHDWSSRCYGLTLGAQRNLGSVLVDSKMAAREEAEQRRLLYVGMTRARDLLVLSGGQTTKPGRDTVFSLLADAVGDDELAGDNHAVSVGDGQITRVIVQANTTKRTRAPVTTSPVPVPALEPLLAQRRTSQERRDRLKSQLRRLTPSLLKEMEPAFVKDAGSRRGEPGDAALVGICAHALLEDWDFTRTSAPTTEELVTLSRQLIPAASDQVSIVERDLAPMMGTFIASDCYRKIQQAVILGREVPFIMPWDGGQVMGGIIDLIYRLDGRVWIADYKTDRVTGPEAQARAGKYFRQATIYCEAATRCLGLSQVSFHFLFLRSGVSVEI